jgi:hypothetical protein
MTITSRETPRTDAFEAEHRNVDDMTAAYAAFEFARTLEGELEAARQKIAEHEMFRHQHRDCDAMGVENQRLRRELAAAERDAAMHLSLLGMAKRRIESYKTAGWIMGGGHIDEANILIGYIDAALSAAGEKGE